MQDNPVFVENGDANYDDDKSKVIVLSMKKRRKVEEEPYPDGNLVVTEALVKLSCDPFKSNEKGEKVTDEDKKKAFYHLTKSNVMKDIKTSKGEKRPSWIKIKQLTDKKYDEFVYDIYHKGIE